MLTNQVSTVISSARATEVRTWKAFILTSFDLHMASRPKILPFRGGPPGGLGAEPHRCERRAPPEQRPGSAPRPDEVIDARGGPRSRPDPRRIELAASGRGAAPTDSTRVEEAPRDFFRVTYALAGKRVRTRRKSPKTARKSARQGSFRVRASSLDTLRETLLDSPPILGGMGARSPQTTDPRDPSRGGSSV